MPSKKPLVVSSGTMQQLPTADQLEVNDLSVAGNVQFAEGAARSIAVQTPATLNANGNNLTVSAAAGNNDGNGGSLSLSAGSGGGGGSVTISAGNSSGLALGGDVTINAGTGGVDAGVVNLGSNVYFEPTQNHVFAVKQPTSNNTSGKNLQVAAAAGAGTGNGGDLTLVAGSSLSLGLGSASGSGGNVILSAGAGGSSAGAGGNVTISGGVASAGLTFGGTVTINAGSGPAGAGNINIGTATTDSLTLGTTGVGNVFANGPFSTNGSFSVNERLIYAAVNTPAQITVDQNNYTLANAVIFRLSSNASRNITGFAGGSNGRTITIINVGLNSIALQNQSASSAVNNRIITGTGLALTLAADNVATLIYDGTTARWRVVSVRQ
jgi:hypothetical protein